MKNNLWTTTTIFKPTEMRASKIKMMYRELQKNYSWLQRDPWTRIPECAARRKMLIIPELKVPTPILTLIISTLLVRIPVAQLRTSNWDLLTISTASYLLFQSLRFLSWMGQSGSGHLKFLWILKRVYWISRSFLVNMTNINSEFSNSIKTSKMVRIISIMLRIIWWLPRSNASNIIIQSRKMCKSRRVMLLFWVSQATAPNY